MKVNSQLLGETLKLLKYLRKRRIVPVFATNHVWSVIRNGAHVRFDHMIAEHVSGVRFHIAAEGTMGWKPTASAVNSILSHYGWTPREAIYVGHSDDDMKTASNGKVLFLNAVWHGEANPYGFQFESALDIARFVDCFCMGLKQWFWAVEAGRLRVYALGPFSTLISSLADAHAYSSDARATAKGFGYNATFWGRLLAARAYFSGLVDEFDYVTEYPGHSTASRPSVIGDALAILAGSARKTYLPDLIVRHQTAPKSQTARTSGLAIGVENQLRTIRLNRAPRRGASGSPYKKPPLSKGKTVLVVDDFCTQGNSLEAARAIIEATGASAISLSWLKTPNRDYNAVDQDLDISNPYIPQVSVPTIVKTKPYGYNAGIRDPRAVQDLSSLHARYADWDWPVDLG